ncbi:uncharacterized protein METZ01_LOCUS195730, partial [marine metagenome]
LRQLRLLMESTALTQRLVGHDLRALRIRLVTPHHN